MKKYLSIVFIITLFIAIGAKSIKSNEASNTTNQADSVAKKNRFKNLTVLPKDISEEKLDSVMANWSISLGVKCNFCHAADSTKKRLDFASDANDHKDVARYMHKMTVDINDKFFNMNHSSQPDTINAVICYTCHRGSKEPSAKTFISLIDSTIDSHRRR